MPYPHDDAKLKSWETGISSSIAKDAAPWNEYDTHIQTVCAVYNKHLAGVSGYVPLDWQLIKAIAWVESGATSTAWKTAPMQIGVNGDPGLRELLTSPTGKLILPPEYAKVLTVSNVPVNGNLNFEAGVGYVLKVTASFGMQTVMSGEELAGLLYKRVAEFGLETYTALQPSLSSLSAAGPFGEFGVTSALTPGLFPMGFPSVASAEPGSKPAEAAPAAGHASGKHGRHRTAKHAARPHPKQQLAIVGWKPRTLQFIAKHYNAGDGNYADKLQFALDLMSGKVKPEAAAAPHPAPHAAKHPPMRVPAGGRQ